MENYRDNEYRLPEPVFYYPRKTITFHKLEPVFFAKEMMNDFTSNQPEEVEEEEIEVEEFDEAFLSEIEKSHRKMGKEWWNSGDIILIDSKLT